MRKIKISGIVHTNSTKDAFHTLRYIGYVLRCTGYMLCTGYVLCIAYVLCIGHVLCIGYVFQAPYLYRLGVGGREPSE